MKHATSFRLPPFNRLSPSARRICLLALLGLLLAGPALAQHISSYLIASGGGTSRSAGGCRVLEGSMGQPVIGTSSGGQFRVQAGYWPGPGSQHRDSVFSGSFEECN
jgi:hypothetical protein